MPGRRMCRCSSPRHRSWNNGPPALRAGDRGRGSNPRPSNLATLPGRGSNSQPTDVVGGEHQYLIPSPWPSTSGRGERNAKSREQGIRNCGPPALRVGDRGRGSNPRPSNLVTLPGGDQILAPRIFRRSNRVFNALWIRGDKYSVAGRDAEACQKGTAAPSGHREAGAGNSGSSGGDESPRSFQDIAGS